MSWIAYLQGRDRDLAVLADMLPGGDLSVEVDEAGNHGMRSTEFADMASATDVRAAAARLLDTVNGVAALCDPTFQPVALTGQVRDGDGHHTHVVLVDSLSVDSLSVVSIMPPAVVVSDDREPPPPQPSEADFVALARRDPNVAEALRYFDANADWFALYKVYEVVRDDLGGNQALVASGLVDARALDSFTESANRREISGDAARHARLRGELSGRSTDLASARQLIRTLVRAWMVAMLS